MKLVSSSPKTRHAHTSRSGRIWIWSQIRSRLSSAAAFKRLAWLLLVLVVAAFATAVFVEFRRTLEAVASQQ